MNFETKYEKIGTNYNLTRSADKFITEKIYSFIKPNIYGLNLDLGCGTGNYTIALSEKGINFIGIEPSKKMLDIAKLKSKNIEWRMGSAENIPVGNETIENIIATLTIHHWSNLEKATEEIFRVMKPDGKLIIFTSCPTQMKNYWLNYYFPKMMGKSMDQMPNIDSIEKILKDHKFQILKRENYIVNNKLEDFFLFSGKERPEIYLEEKFRNGISSFSSLSNKEEVEKGLEQLRKDIETNKIQEIKRNYNSNNGDYTFLVAKKTSI